MANKVEFGISQLHVGTYTIVSGSPVLGTPYHQKGAISFSPEEQSDKTNFYADNIVYYGTFSGGSFEGDLEVAKFDDKFKTDFLGYKATTDSGLAVVKNAERPDVYVAFQVEGDVEKRRIILLNAQLGPIKREYSTIEDTKEPATESLTVSVMGDLNSGISMISYKENTTGYSAVFSSPSVPAITGTVS